ncbi:MAG: CGNR zinc finger domain-containing protein [Cyanobacteria bacterium SZAS LIN-2]|nr:CGNR zinc finger domain-containing protein [Cyanobacteria bacterium SZAS LIN-2]
MSGQDHFIFIANHPGLDFINTRMKSKNQLVELLGSPADLLQWMFAAYLISAADIAYAEKNWTAQDLREAFLDALRLREAGLRAMESEGHRSAALSIVNEYLARPAIASELVATSSGYALRDYPVSAEGLVPLIARQVSGIFTDLDAGLIKKCRNDKCVLYFYDTSKNHARSWCSMEICGNRAKAAKHYQTHANQVP